MSRWFRFYDNVIDDPKVQRLSDFNFRGWVNLMCLASKHDGKIPDNLADLAFALRLSENKTRDLLQVLQSANLIERFEAGHYEPHNWATRQYKSDTSATRTKEWRERTKTVTRDGVVTSQEQDVTVTVTPPEADTEQIQNRTEQKDNRPARKRASKPVVVPESFGEFWQAYPDSRAKADALKAYCQALDRGVLPADLLAGARRYALECKGKDKQYIKLAGGWIRGERWNDESGSKPALCIVPRMTPEEEAEERENLKRLGVIH